MIVQNTATDHPYVSTQTGGGARVFRHPARDRVPHAQKLKSEIDSATKEAETRITAVGDDIEIEGIALEFIGSANDILETDKLDDRTSKIELLSVRKEGDREYGTVRVPRAKLKNFLAKIERYETETDQRRKDQGPKNKDLVESIDGVRLPVLRSFWTDVLELFPENVSQEIWWEVWLRTGSDDHDEVFAAFVVEAERIGLRLCQQVVKFPERLVFIAYGAATVWANSFALLDMVAELRKAKEISTDYVGLPPRDQALVVEDGAERMTPPPESAPAVCLLDTGVSAGHPLLVKVLDEADVRAVHPEWSVTDEQGHGTLMAGVATFGAELAEHLAGNDMRQFQHRLESVKLLHPTVRNDPDNYGYVTTEAVAIAEAARPERDRIACLAVTSDDLDVGHPTLWSAAIDQHASGALDDEHRLYVVSAGNIREFSRENYEYLSPFPKSCRR